jgi:dipeptidyl aminopeptidase/acylaminoacyl peptidase
MILELGAPALPAYEELMLQQEPFVAAEHQWSGLSAELERRPLSSIFTRQEYRRLEMAIATERCLQVVYSSGGVRVCGYIVLPSERRTPRPTVLFARGGNSDRLGTITPLTLLDLLALAEGGYVVLATQYRGGPGSEGHDQFGGDDLQDLLNLAALARGFDDADVGRLFLWRVSRGGMMAALALRAGLAVRAVALRAPMVDLAETASSRPDVRAVFEELMPDWAADPALALARRSALRWPEQLRAPTLLLHGRQDQRVALGQSERLADALRGLGREVELVVYEHDSHLLLLHRGAYLDAIKAWFDAHDRS